MDYDAVRPVDPAELPSIVADAVQIADDAALSPEDRAVLLPLIYGTLSARAIMPKMPTALASPAALGSIIRGGH